MLKGTIALVRERGWRCHAFVQFKQGNNVSTTDAVDVCVYVCVCVCVCVCLYCFTYWLLPTARCLWHTWEVRIKDLLLPVLLRASSKFLHLHFRICHTSPPKAWLQPAEKLERKRYYILESCEKMINIDIGDKTPTCQTDKLRKDKKDKEATLI